MKKRIIVSTLVIGVLLMTSLALIVTGEPSKNNPRRNDFTWVEESTIYNVTYLANGNVTPIIDPPDIFEFQGTGVVVMWETIYTEADDSITQRHRVLKIVDGEIVKENINWIGVNASLNVTNNPSMENNSDDNYKNDGITLDEITSMPIKRRDRTVS